jgi:hypothetical protein
LNRYSYVYNNPHKYVDPDGHIVILATMAIGAGIGAAITTGTYLLTTPQDEWDAGEVALVAGVGAAGGALIGTGVGAAAGGAMLAGVATGAGVGAVVSAETYMVNNAIEGESFDSTDFAITTGFGAAEGAVSGIPSVGPVGRVCASGAFAGGESMVHDLVDGNSIDGAKAARATGMGLLSGVAGEAISGGLQPASSGRYIPEGAEFVNLVPTALKPDPVLADMAVEQTLRHAGRTATRDLAYGFGSTVVEDRVSNWIDRGVR